MPGKPWELGNKDVTQGTGCTVNKKQVDAKKKLWGDDGQKHTR